MGLDQNRGLTISSPYLCYVNSEALNEKVRVLRSRRQLDQPLELRTPGKIVLKRVGTHTLPHSCPRHLLLHDVPINYLSRWRGHSSTQATLI